MFKTQWNYKNSSGQANNLPSKTIPDQSMTVREMYRRMAAGQPVTINPNLEYTGDEFVPNFEMLDPVERDEYIEKITRENEFNKKAIAERDAKQKSDAEAAEKNQFEELFKKYGSVPDPVSKPNEPAAAPM